ncbi:similar to Saccharomyces cerevisiae YER056C FCY2 Purine-cytosine permease, mediates purine (adenine, guanine, and hypoxanthine) and cytosine accumulation [Maudiozyma saulgeensis]|uniref:Similar to Saccharomyces cerevisiae YER056C FCY2 Purine-cytosine permease, mediates purine (Adenine, guanine, and hypoxanthine) and cytosine accumulation n=1 Tax=Maudiozyma saulgeensis TaxID=1789683 RepID=A0A1X7QYQ3_9SACH|nr:similar to Saccharomyces cerevisiae YER056C FCY2 Purine-cytosine permease, mediates purine (adenine, guanine, and hypoxanthine) and cytosine accumulation [Kazachstania saulgeensis]
MSDTDTDMHLNHRGSVVGNSKMDEDVVYEMGDVEKGSQDFKTIPIYEFEEQVSEAVVEETKLSLISRFAASLNAETKGVEPIEDDEKTDDSMINAASMWFSANMVIAAYALGGLGPMVYGLNFGTSCLVIIFFNIFGAFWVAFFSVFGSEFGLRQMILSRFLIGNVTARIFCVINIIACIGWGIVNTVASAQLLNMVNSPHECPLWAGCLIIVGCTVVVTFFGYNVIHLYEKWSWVPNFAVFLVIIARLKISGKFENGPWGGGPATAAGVLSFGTTVFGFAAGWTTYAADYTVYMPRDSNKYKMFFSLMIGLLLPLYFTMFIGAAAGAAALTDPEWQAYYDKNAIGGVTYAILVPNSLHGFGQFCCVLLAMSTVANNIPNMYTIALSVQALWKPFSKVPRVVWTMAGNAFTLGIGIPACYYFETFMQSFMDSIGYYLAIYIAISASEHFFYRKGFKGYNIADWDTPSRLPIGIAGTSALIAGAFGVALGMSQTYWTGEIGALIGPNGGDIGFEMGGSWAFIVYNVLRPLEKKYTGR